VRILLLLGLLVLGLAMIVRWQDDRVAAPEKSIASPEGPRLGRSTLSHGGPPVGGRPDVPERPLKPLQTVPSDPSPQATKR